MQPLRTIAIIGGGFAGTTLARVLDGNNCRCRSSAEGSSSMTTWGSKASRPHGPWVTVRGFVTRRTILSHHAPPSSRYTRRAAWRITSWRRSAESRRGRFAIDRVDRWPRSAIAAAWQKCSAYPSGALRPGSCGALITYRRCRRSAASSGSLSSGRGRCCFALTSHTCAFTEASISRTGRRSAADSARTGVALSHRARH